MEGPSKIEEVPDLQDLFDVFFFVAGDFDMTYFSTQHDFWMHQAQAEKRFFFIPLKLIH